MYSLLKKNNPGLPHTDACCLTQCLGAEYWWTRPRRREPSGGDNMPLLPLPKRFRQINLMTQTVASEGQRKQGWEGKAVWMLEASDWEGTSRSLLTSVIFVTMIIYCMSRLWAVNNLSCMRAEDQAPGPLPDTQPCETPLHPCLAERLRSDVNRLKTSA